MERMLIFPVRGNPPADQPGYTRDGGNPYLFKLTQPPCELRETVTPCKGCPGRASMEYCNFYDKPSDPLECLTCGGKQLAVNGLKELPIFQAEAEVEPTSETQV